MIRRPGESRDPYRVISRQAKPLPGVMGPGFRRDDADGFGFQFGTVRRVGKGAPAPCPPCNARLAMVGTLRFAHPTHSHVHPRSRGMIRPRFASLRPVIEQRAQGRPGARCTRGLVCKLHIRKRTRAYRFSGGNPAFPARWCYGLLRALPGDRLSCHRHPRDTSRALSASIGAPGPHDFTVREKPRSSVVTSASTASHRTFVTIASRPSCRVRRASW